MAGSSPAPSAKLYAVTRADLPVGFRAAQVGHALLAYALAGHPVPDNLVVLQVGSGQALVELLSLLQRKSVAHVDFCEPDLGGELTAIAVEPQGKQYLSSLSLMR